MTSRNNNLKEKKLLKRYVKESLNDYKSFLVVEYISSDDSDMGGSYGTQDDLFNTFIKPFADVIGTVIGQTKEVARRGMTVLHVAFETLMTTLVPFLTDSYDEIFAKEKADVQAIRSQYQSYYDSTSKALGSSEAKILAFMAFPGAALTGKFVSDSPGAVKGILSVATGGISDEYLGSRGSSQKGPSSVFDSYSRAYCQLLSEDNDNKNVNSASPTLVQKIGSKKFIDFIIKKSPMMKAAQKEASILHQAMINERIKPILSIIDASTLEELSKVLKKPLIHPDMKNLDPEQKLSTQEFENKSLISMKNTAIAAAIKEIQKYIEPIMRSFGNDHPVVQDYTRILDAIKLGNVTKLKQQLGI